MALSRSAAKITPKAILLAIYLSSLNNKVVMAAGGHWPAARGADVKSNGIIEFSGPNNSKIDTLNDISVIFFLILVLRRAAGDH